MSLSLRQKQTFYHELAQFLRTGIPMPQAVEALTPDTPRGAMRDVLERLRELFRQKETVQGAFAKLPPAISDMEVTLIDAASTSGRLDQACLFLAAYFESLAGMRAGTIKQITWPLVQLHFGVLILGVPKVFAGGSISDYLAQSLGTLAVFYGAAIAVGLAVAALLRLASRNAGVDRVLRGIPVVGALRRNLSLSRFCAVYEMQLQAAINIMDALRSAAKASQSALTASEIERIIPQVRDGAQVGSQLAGSPAFPAALQRVIRIGEDTGSLDEDLRKWSEYYRNAAVANLETIGSWLPRVIFAIIAAYLVYGIITVYEQAYIKPVQDMLNQ